MSHRFPQALFALIFGLLFAASASATTYYVAANGSDSNNGTSTSTPWLHAPGMPKCSATCNSATINPGDSIIFRGGDTWHFQNPTPSSGVYTGGSWTWGFNGTGTSCQLNADAGTVVKTSCIYIGTSSSFYNSSVCGASFCRPFFTDDAPISHTRPSSCTYDVSTFDNVILGTHTYLVFDDFDMSGACWQNGPNGGWVNSGGQMVEISNNYFHGWELGTGGSVDDTWYAVHGNMPKGNYIRLDHNVFDNSDGALGNMGGGVSCGASCQASGGDISNTGSEIDHNVFNQTSNNVENNFASFHDNLMENAYNNGTPQHKNLLETNTGVAATGTLYIYNNLVHDYNVDAIWPEPVQANIYTFNNVIYNNLSAGGCLRIDGQGASGTPITAYFVNNTMDSSCNLNVYGEHSGQEFNGTVVFENQFPIGFQSATCTGTCGTPLALIYYTSGSPTLTVTNNGGHGFLSTATANSDGFMTSNNYAPTSSGNPTVGNNMSSFCSSIPGATAASACANGTTNGCSEVAGQGGLVVSCYAATANARLTGAWDAGAYELGSTSLPAAPTGLAAVVQ